MSTEKRRDPLSSLRFSSVLQIIINIKKSQIIFFKNEINRKLVRSLDFPLIINSLNTQTQDPKSMDLKAFGQFLHALTLVLQKRALILLEEALAYIRSISYDSRIGPTRVKKPKACVTLQNFANVGFLNQNAFTHAIEIMENNCEEIIGKDPVRRLSGSQEINLNISLADRMSQVTSSSKLSEGQNTFKENLEENLRILMNKDAEKFMFLSSESISNDRVAHNSTPKFNEERVDFSYQSDLFTPEIRSSNDLAFNDRVKETMKKMGLFEGLSSVKRGEKESDEKQTAKKRQLFDREIALLSQKKEDKGQNGMNYLLGKGVEINEGKEDAFDLMGLTMSQSVKFMIFLNNFEGKTPEKYRKTLTHIARTLYRVSESDPERLREDKMERDPDFIGEFREEMRLESSVSGLSEMKSNFSSFYESMKKNAMENKEDHELFMRYYNDGLKTIEETTENLASKTDFNTRSHNLQSRSVIKSELKGGEYRENPELDQTTLALLRYLEKKTDSGRKAVTLSEITKGCEKGIKIQTFLEMLKLSTAGKVDLEQEKSEFGEIYLKIFE